MEKREPLFDKCSNDEFFCHSRITSSDTLDRDGKPTITLRIAAQMKIMHCKGKAAPFVITVAKP
eukprot:CCRYP_005966-RA/>CCRYP_005966-RA protein AED:0.41 eAED:0.41 QI:31/1/0.5/1/0/0/2/0/63